MAAKAQSRKGINQDLIVSLSDAEHSILGVLLGGEGCYLPIPRHRS